MAAATLAGCHGTTAAAVPVPSTGLLLLDLESGAPIASVAVGSDAVAVAVSGDGRFAYLADSAPGDVYAVALPSGHVAWKTHVGGAPFGMVLHAGTLYVTLFDAATVTELRPSDGSVLARDPTYPHPAAVTVDVNGNVVPAGGLGFGIALVGGDLWTADYKGSALLPQGEGMRVPLPLPLHPFWLAPGPSGTLLTAAEGDSEDSDPGAVYSYDPPSGRFTMLARPRDPDQVIAVGSAVFVAAHGDHEVLRIGRSSTATWALGASAVALAPDTQRNMLVVAVNSHE